jgi:hypothetical protein
MIRIKIILLADKMHRVQNRLDHLCPKDLKKRIELFMRYREIMIALTI